MSRQLSLSAAFSRFTMALFALFASASAYYGSTGENARMQPVSLAASAIAD